MFFKTFFVFLVAILLWEYSDGQRHKKFFREDYTFIDAVESFYKFHTTEATWLDAKQVCAQEGASLLYPENDNEAQAARSFWNDDKPNDGREIFVSISDLSTLGVYETTDGKLLSEVYHNWKDGEPNNSGGTLRCITMTPSNRLVVRSCTDHKPFICKKTLQSLQWNYCCDIYDLDYTDNKDTGNCYKLHATPLNWTDASATCRAEQSYLAVINNQLETDYLVNLMESASKLRAEGNYFRGIFHVGFHNTTQRRWRTVKGTPVSEDVNGWWGNNQAEGRDQCGSMFYNGRLGNINCDTKSFFICEHEVGTSNFSLLETNYF